MIAEVDGEAVAGVEDLLLVIKARADGDAVAVKIWRKCDRRLAETVTVRLIASDKLKSGGIAPGKRATSLVGSRGGVWQ
jgi:hypothetical protein